jgi:hypothetical protein
MNRNIFTRRHAMREAIFNIAAALLLIGGGVVLLLSFFDVLVK